MRKNKDGKYNLRDLRAAVESSDSVSVYRNGGNWIISRYSDQHKCWIQQTMPYFFTERDTLMNAMTNGGCLIAYDDKNAY